MEGEGVVGEVEAWLNQFKLVSTQIPCLHTFVLDQITPQMGFSNVGNILFVNCCLYLQKCSLMAKEHWLV